jgi:hypothetical protein
VIYPFFIGCGVTVELKKAIALPNLNGSEKGDRSGQV